MHMFDMFEAQRAVTRCWGLDAKGGDEGNMKCSVEGEFQVRKRSNRFQLGAGGGIGSE